MLVRGDASIVKAQVVLIGRVPSGPLSRIHDRPTALTLFLDGTLGTLLSEVARNDGTSSLHVEEVGGQGTLGRIRIMSPLLALLLLLNRSLLDPERSRHELAEAEIKFDSLEVGTLTKE